MAKRKRNNATETAAPAAAAASSKKVKSVAFAAPSKQSSTTTTVKPTTSKTSPVTIQIITGSYDRILHGLTATITPSAKQSASTSSSAVEFADTFLFNAHTSAIRTLALSPPTAPIPKQTQKRILATGSTDERINLYHISAHAPSRITVPIIPSLTSRAVVENSSNKELGSLLHHGATVTRVYFPNRGKLLSSAEDSTIAVTRTRDWSLLSTIKAPIPKAIGRPSGDTAPVGGQPSGVNDFAVHPSMKLMISVGKGEKCMRLWNLVTGKKAGALTFERNMLIDVGEGRYSSGEGRKVAWGADGEGGEEFSVVFEKGILIFGMDCKPKCKVITKEKTKIHQVKYVNVGEDEDVLALSTEDGRILFFSTKPSDLIAEEAKEGKEAPLPTAKLVSQLGGKAAGIAGRIKDFSILRNDASDSFIAATASSEGAVKIWDLPLSDLIHKEEEPKQVGKLLGTYETTNRVTCLEAFIMLPSVDEENEDEDVGDEVGIDDDDVEEDSASDSE